MSHRRARPIPLRRLLTPSCDEPASLTEQRHRLQPSANEPDEDFCAWARSAAVGDRYEAMHVESVRCVSGVVS